MAFLVLNSQFSEVWITTKTRVHTLFLSAAFVIQYILHQQWGSCGTDLLGVKHWQASQRYTGLNWADKYHRLRSLALQHCCIHHPECRLTTTSGVPPSCLIPGTHLLPTGQLKSSERFPPPVCFLDFVLGSSCRCPPASLENLLVIFIPRCIFYSCGGECIVKDTKQGKSEQRQVTDVLYKLSHLYKQCSRVITVNK